MRSENKNLYLETNEFAIFKKAFGGSYPGGYFWAGTFQKLFSGNIFKKPFGGNF